MLFKLQILKLYSDNKKCCNTSIGALSNLVLDGNLKQQLGKEDNLPILLKVTNKHLFDENIACTAAGMLGKSALLFHTYYCLEMYRVYIVATAALFESQVSHCISVR